MYFVHAVFGLFIFGIFSYPIAPYIGVLVLVYEIPMIFFNVKSILFHNSTKVTVSDSDENAGTEFILHILFLTFFPIFRLFLGQPISIELFKLLIYDQNELGKISKYCIVFIGIVMTAFNAYWFLYEAIETLVEKQTVLIIIMSVLTTQYFVAIFLVPLIPLFKERYSNEQSEYSRQQPRGPPSEYSALPPPYSVLSEEDGNSDEETQGLPPPYPGLSQQQNRNSEEPHQSTSPLEVVIIS